MEVYHHSSQQQIIFLPDKNNTNKSKLLTPLSQVYLLFMKIKNSNTDIKKIVKNEEQSQQYLHEDEEEIGKFRFRPFYMKFSRIKTQVSPHQSDYSLLTESVKVSEGVISKKVYTEAETNEIYQTDFEEVSDLDFQEQTVEEQLQNIDNCTISDQSQGEQPQNQHFEGWNKKKLMRINKKLIDSIQFLRQGLRKYKRNFRILRSQQELIKNLKKSTSKALDCSYQIHLDRQNANKTEQEHIKVSRIKKVSLMLKKSHYQSVQQSNRIIHPNMFQMQKESLQSNLMFDQLSQQKQQLLAKKRQFYQNEKQIKLLTLKEDKYRQIIDKFQSILSRSDTKSLKVRRQFLTQQISSKQTQTNIKEIEINTEITSFSNRIVSIEARIMSIKKQQQMMKISMKQKEGQLISMTDSHMKESKIKLIKSVHYSKPKSVSQTVMKNNKISVYQSGTPKSKRAVVKFYYNPQNKRNSNIVLKNAI